jgi:two-component system chemotaxis response regulator CheY
MARKVLVIDDSKSIRVMVVAALKRGGFEVFESANGEDGLKQLDSTLVDLVITDLNMPVMDGISFIRELRARADSCKSIPALLLTTDTFEEQKEDARQAGATGWVVKPFRTEQLLNVVNKLLPVA